MLGRETPVARFVVVTLLLLALLLSAALGAFNHLSERARLRGELRDSAQVETDQLAASLALPAWNFDQSQIEKIAQSVLHDREAAGLDIRIADRSAPGGFRRFQILREHPGTAAATAADAAEPGDSIFEERPVMADGQQLGTVKAYFTTRYMDEALRRHLVIQLLTFLSFGIILAVCLYFLLWRIVLRPIWIIEQYAGAISSRPDEPTDGGMRGRFRGELERLRSSIEKMVALLAARYATLKQNESRLAGQLQFERLVAEVTSRLVAARPENLHPILSRALEDMAHLLDADRVVLGRTEDSTAEMVARAHFRRTEPPFPERLVISERYPGLWAQLLRGETSVIAEVAQMDGAMEADRRHFEEVGIRSQITVPVFVEKRLRYILAAATVGRQARWSDDTVMRVRVLAELLATTALRCESEEEVRSGERQFRAFIEQAPVPILLTPSPDGAPLYFNPAFTRIFGYTREDISRPEDWWPRLYPDPAYRARRYASWLKTTERARETGDFQDADEAEMHTKSGEIRYAQVRICFVGGYRMSFINDFTARRQAEIALRLTQYAVDNNPVMIFRIDLDGRFVYVNEAACARFGYSPAEILHLHLWDIAQTVNPAEWPARRDILRESRSTRLETVYATRNGGSFPVEVRIQYVNFSGIQQFFAYATDITDRRTAQEAQFAYTRRIHTLATELTRAEERQRRELATMLHDGVGQNLFAATTQLLALRSREAEPPQELGRAITLLDQVTRDTRELTFELCPPVLYQLGLIPALQRLADQFSARHHIPCSVTGSTAGPEDLNARGLAYQAVRELLNNIAKHARAQHVSIAARDVDGQVWLEISDDGAGFDPARLGPGATTGTGFGLFHLRERLELLGGSLAIQSAPGCGASVRFSLPSRIQQPAGIPRDS